MNDHATTLAAPAVRRTLPGALALSLLLLAGRPAAAAIVGGCVDDVSGDNNVCTANDVTFVVVGLGVQQDGCVGTNDNNSIFLRGILRNTTAQTRYDIGMYIATDGDPNGDGAETGTCTREILTPPGTTGVTTCPALNLLGGSGPYLNTDGDACSDLFAVGNSGCDQNSDGQWDDSVFDFTDTVTFPCRDVNGDGFVNLPTCSTWGNNDNQVGGASCDGAAEAVPGTKSKCRCEDVNTTIPVAQLSLACSCTPGSVRPGQSTACTVTYSNALDCTPDLATEERFRCGTSSFIRFKTDYNETIGAIFSTPSPVTPAVSGSGSVDSSISPVPSVADPVVWRPRNQITGGSLGIVGDNQSGTLSFQYLVDAGTANGTYTIATTDTYWSNVSDFSPEVQQTSLSAACSITVSDTATWVAVSKLEARERGGQVVVEWETAAEVGTLGFAVERWDAAAGAFVPVREGLVPAVGQAPGGRYRLADPGAPARPADGVLTYRVVEVDRQGRRQVWGPFRTEVAPARERGAGLREGFASEGKAPSERVIASAARRKLRAVTAGVAAAGGPASAAKIEVAAGGMVRVRAAQLASGLNEPVSKVASDLKLGRYRLHNRGAEVAWEAAPDGDGLVFHGEAIASPFAARNVYWLERGSGARVGSVAGAAAAAAVGTAAFAETLHLEEDTFPGVFAAASPRDDYWFWRSLVAGFPGMDAAALDVAVPSPAGGTSALDVHLHLFGAARFQVKVNGSSLGEHFLSGSGPAAASFALPAGLLEDGANRVEVTALEGFFYLDSFDLAYPRLYRARAGALAFRGDGNDPVTIGGFPSAAVALYDLADRRAPRRVTGVVAEPAGDGTYRLSFRPADAARPYLAVAAGGLLPPAAVRPDAASDLRGGGNGAAYLVLASPELRAGADRLATHRARQSLSTLVVDLEDVMDEFNHGVPDPEAVRRFLAHAVDAWREAPRYVVLTGKGSYDYRDLWGLGLPGVPASMVATPDGLVAADGSFADFDDDGLPELAVGRIPALDAAELAAYVDKVIAYESAAAGAWSRRATLVADDADHGGDFAATSDLLAGPLTAAGLALNRVYLPSPAGGADVENARALLTAALNEGRGLVNFVGHGGLDRLTSEGLLTIADLSALGNGARQPVFTALTCNIGLFAFPGFSSIGEELVMLPSGGAVALFAPAGLSFNGEAAQLGRHLLGRLASSGGLLGDRTLGGLAAYAAAGGDRVAVRSYNLLGDPGLRVKP